MTLLSLAPKQIRPQVLTFEHLNANRVLLLHSGDAAETKGPALRFKPCPNHSPTHNHNSSLTPRP